MPKKWRLGPVRILNWNGRLVKHSRRTPPLTRIKTGLVAGMGGLVLLSLGCVTRQDIRGVQADLYTIQKSIETRLGNVKDQTETVQTTQADLAADMQGLRDHLSALQTELEDNRTQMKSLGIRLDDLETSLSARMDAQIELLSGSKFVEKPLPSTVFNLANTDFTRGRDQEALKGFESYIRQFPKGQRVGEAKMKIADIYARLNNGTKALDVLDQIIQDQPKSSLAPAAMLKKGGILENMGRTTQATLVYQILIKTHPHSVEARTAQQKSIELQNKK